MKKLISEYWKLLLIIAIPYIFIVSSAFIKVNYDVVTPALIDKVSSEIKIENEDNCYVSTVSVYSYTKVSLLNYLVAKLNPNATITETYEYEVTDYKTSYSSGVIQKRVSIYNAIIAGYKEAGYDNIIDENSFKGYIIHNLYTFASNELKIGDIITHFDGVKLDGLTGENEFEKLENSIEFNKNASYPIIVLRQVKDENDDIAYETYEFEIKANAYIEQDGYNSAFFGFDTYEYIVPNMPGDIPEYSWKYGSSIGPSGGLMQALYVYDSLNYNSLTRNLNIVGTGTVDAYGNAGAIGGIYQKVLTADLCGADIFFVPVSNMDKNVYENEKNYKDALKAYNTLKNTKMKLVVVSSLSDIIEYLSSN